MQGSKIELLTEICPTLQSCGLCEETSSVRDHFTFIAEFTAQMLSLGYLNGAFVR